MVHKKAEHSRPRQQLECPHCAKKFLSPRQSLLVPQKKQSTVVRDSSLECPSVGDHLKAPRSRLEREDAPETTTATTGLGGADDSFVAHWNWIPSTHEEELSFIKTKSEFSAAVVSELGLEWQTAKEILDALKEKVRIVCCDPSRLDRGTDNASMSLLQIPDQ